MKKWKVKKLWWEHLESLPKVFFFFMTLTDAAGWQEEGKKAFAANQHAEALRCYAEVGALLVSTLR